MGLNYCKRNGNVRGEWCEKKELVRNEKKQEKTIEAKEKKLKEWSIIILIFLRKSDYILILKYVKIKLR